MDSRSYDVMKVEDIEELIKVRAPFQFPALMYSNLFRHRSTLYYHHTSDHLKKLATETKTLDAAQTLAWLAWTVCTRLPSLL